MGGIIDKYLRSGTAWSAYVAFLGYFGYSCPVHGIGHRMESFMISNSMHKLSREWYLP
jgi:hypothetical protein